LSDTFSIQNGLNLADALLPSFSALLYNTSLGRFKQTRSWRAHISFWPTL